MIGTEQLEEFVRLALLSSYIKDERPVSLLIASRVESGKTEVVSKAAVCQGVLYISDLTAWGLQKKYLQKIADKEIRTIVIPDLIAPLSKRTSTVETFTAFLSMLTEEGAVEIQTYAIDRTFKQPVRCNVITCIAKEFLSDRRYRWAKAGFLSRVLPVSYAYAPSKVYEIARSIADRDYHDESTFADLEFPDDDVTIGLPKDIAHEVASLVPYLVDAEKLYGFRLQKQLQTLCMANALYEGRDEVTRGDLDKIKELSNYVNLRYREIR